jgi:hypothetical protein
MTYKKITKTKVPSYKTPIITQEIIDSMAYHAEKANYYADTGMLRPWQHPIEKINNLILENIQAGQTVHTVTVGPIFTPRFGEPRPVITVTLCFWKNGNIRDISVDRHMTWQSKDLSKVTFYPPKIKATK